MMVGEHSIQRRRLAVRLIGADRRDYAGMSNDNPDEKSGHRKPKVS
jgi:hypothetical protein